MPVGRLELVPKNTARSAIYSPSLFPQFFLRIDSPWSSIFTSRMHQPAQDAVGHRRIADPLD